MNEHRNQIRRKNRFVIICTFLRTWYRQLKHKLELFYSNVVIRFREREIIMNKIILLSSQFNAAIYCFDLKNHFLKVKSQKSFHLFSINIIVPITLMGIFSMISILFGSFLDFLFDFSFEINALKIMDVSDNEDCKLYSCSILIIFSTWIPDINQYFYYPVLVCNSVIQSLWSFI